MVYHKFSQYTEQFISSGGIWIRYVNKSTIFPLICNECIFNTSVYSMISFPHCNICNICISDWIHLNANNIHVLESTLIILIQTLNDHESLPLCCLPFLLFLLQWLLISMRCVLMLSVLGKISVKWCLEYNNNLQNTETQRQKCRLMGSFWKLVYMDSNECNMFIQYCGRLYRKESCCGEHLTATLWGKFCELNVNFEGFS